MKLRSSLQTREKAEGACLVQDEQVAAQAPPLVCHVSKAEAQCKRCTLAFPAAQHGHAALCCPVLPVCASCRPVFSSILTSALVWAAI